MKKQPLVFKSIFKPKPWGNYTLLANSCKKIGERWDICDLEYDCNIVSHGHYAGKTLHKLMQDMPEALLGKARNKLITAKFPLLFKLISTSDNLSIQVHPNDEYAQSKNPGSLGKYEAWYIIEAEPDACIYSGIKPEVTKTEFYKAVNEDNILSTLVKYAVKPGDIFDIPPGIIHAIGKGLLVAEIQQNSDITYRIHDWGRCNIDGTKRELHLEDALLAINFDQQCKELKPRIISEKNYIRKRFIANDKFMMDVCTSIDYNCNKPWIINTENISFHILLFIDSGGEVITSSGKVIRKNLESVLIPAAACEYKIIPENEKTKVLLFSV